MALIHHLGALIIDCVKCAAIVGNVKRREQDEKGERDDEWGGSRMRREKGGTAAPWSRTPGLGLNVGAVRGAVL
jgi:hypothetical protein